jgi:hypothetical protein
MKYPVNQFAITLGDNRNMCTVTIRTRAIIVTNKVILFLLLPAVKTKTAEQQ